MRHTDPRVTPLYSGEPTGRPPARYEVQTWEVGILTSDVEPEWQSNYNDFDTEREAIKEAKRLQGRGFTVRVVPIVPELPEERIARYKREAEAARREERRDSLRFTVFVVGLVAACLSIPALVGWFMGVL